MIVIKYYNTVENLLKFGIKKAIKFINEALMKENDEKFWDLYVAVYPNFDSKNFMNFTNFKKAVTGNYEPTMTDEDKKRIDERTDKIREKFRKS
jgi:hypothetical protein